MEEKRAVVVGSMKVGLRFFTKFAGANGHLGTLLRQVDLRRRPLFKLLQRRGNTQFKRGKRRASKKGPESYCRSGSTPIRTAWPSFSTASGIGVTASSTHWHSGARVDVRALAAYFTYLAFTAIFLDKQQPPLPLSLY